MGILVWIVVGVGAGLVGHAVIRAPEPIGLVNMMVAGVGGSVVGGVAGHALSGAHDNDLHRASLIGSIAGAVVLLVIVGVICRRLMSE